MKLKEILVVAAVGVIAACGSPYRATDNATVVVAPPGVQTAFTTQYPNAINIVWSTYDAAVVPIDWELAGWATLDEGDYLVRFDMDNENYYAWYDDSGNWVGTTYVIRDHATVPSAVTEAATKQFPGYTISNVNREFQKDRIAYEVEMKSGDTKAKLLIDANGNIIKQKSKAINQ